MSPSADGTDPFSAWPERWPVAGPALAALIGSMGAAIALADGDGVAGTVFSAFAMTMVLVGARNYAFTARAHEQRRRKRHE